QVHDVRVEVVGPEGAARAACVPARIEHEVVDDELASSFEELRKGPSPIISVERVVLLDPFPGQLAPLTAQLVAEARELLLLRKELPALCEPFVMIDHPAHHVLLS